MKAFLPGASGLGPPVGGQASRVVDLRGPVVATPAPPEAPPVLTVSKSGFWTISKAMMRALGISPGVPVKLLPPKPGVAGKRRWLLLVRPEFGEGQPLAATGFMRAPALPAQCFQRPRPTKDAAGLVVESRNEPLHTLTFTLGQRQPTYTEAYELLAEPLPTGLSSEQVADIQRQLTEGVAARRLAKEYGVNFAIIAGIRSGSRVAGATGGVEGKVEGRP